MSETVPDPLRNLQADEVIAITNHAAFQRPEHVDEETWTGAVETVRDAAEKMKLDVAADTSNLKFLGAVCKDVDARVRRCMEVDSTLVSNDAVNAVRQEIGLFFGIRIRLGRHAQFEKLLEILRAKSGVVTIVELERNKAVKAIAATLRAIPNNAGNTVERRTAVWAYVKEFLAQQAGIEKVDFPGLKIKEGSGDVEDDEDERVVAAGTGDKPKSKDLKNKLKDLGIDLTHLEELEKHQTAFEGSYERALASTTRYVGAIEALLTPLKEFLAAKGGPVSKGESEDESKAPSELRPYFRRLKELKAARIDLMTELGVTELEGEEAGCFQNAVDDLEAEYAEPLARYRADLAKVKRAENERRALDGLIQKLETKLATAKALGILLEHLIEKKEQVAAPAEATSAVRYGNFVEGGKVKHNSLGSGTIDKIDTNTGKMDVKFSKDDSVKTFAIDTAAKFFTIEQ